MFAKVNFKAIVTILTVGLTSLFIYPAESSVQADSLTISSATMTQELGETATAGASVASFAFLATAIGDTYSATVSLVSAPSGNTRMPVLRLIETTSAVVFTSNASSPLSLYSIISANTAVKISPPSSSGMFVYAKFQIYMDAPDKTGTYVVKVFPAIVGGGGTANALPQTITITVGGSIPVPDPSQSLSPPVETSTPDSYTASLNITTALPTQLTSKNQTTSDLFLNLFSYANNAGDTSSVSVLLVSAPAGSTALPVLELVQQSNSRIDDSALLNGELSPGAVISSQYAYMTGVITPGAMSARFKLYLNNPKKPGTYVIKVQPRITSGAGTAPSGGLTLTLVVSRDPDSYPVSGEVIISNPGDITNKSDAAISVTKTADSTNEVAVIRTAMKTSTGLTTLLDSYTAVITGPGVLGTAPLSTDINTTGSYRSLQVKAGDAVTVYGDGTAGTATISIATYDGTIVASKNITFVDLTNQAIAILALTFSSFPEKGTPMSLSALVNLPGSVKFTTNGKTLGSCARVTASGTPKIAVCQWRPPTSGSINIVAKFTPSDSGIAPVSTTKLLAIGRRTGRR
jgi:hypothetical protein